MCGFPHSPSNQAGLATAVRIFKLANTSFKTALASHPGIVPVGISVGPTIGTIVTGGVINNVRCSVGSYTASSFLPKKEIASSPQ